MFSNNALIPRAPWLSEYYFVHTSPQNALNLGSQMENMLTCWGLIILLCACKCDQRAFFDYFRWLIIYNMSQIFYSTNTYKLRQAF